MAVTKVMLRRAAREQLAERFTGQIERKTGKGIGPGGRLRATPETGNPFNVAVRTGKGRLLGFSRVSEGRWRTLADVEQVLVAVHSEGLRGGADIYAFESKVLIEQYDQALEGLKASGRTPALDVPILIPLDAETDKNVGHGIVGLKALASWSAEVGPDQLKQDVEGNEENFIERVKREFAELTGADVSSVVVEFRIKA